MKLLDGKALSSIVKESLKKEIKDNGLNITLAVIKVGNDSASAVYVRNKQKACEYVRIKSSVYNLDENVEEEELISLIRWLNINNEVNGILVQLPLPKHINTENVLSKIKPEKDVDGFHAINMGNLVLNKGLLTPCTAEGIMQLLYHYDIEIEGKECVVVGRSNIVGKPVALRLLNDNGTVTICHSKTKKLQDICKTADILICAIGKPKYFNKNYIKDGAVVIDVGIHRNEDGSLCGDVDFERVKDMDLTITPVPGGVGPMTVAMLLSNCLIAAKLQEGAIINGRRNL